MTATAARSGVHGFVIARDALRRSPGGVRVDGAVLALAGAAAAGVSTVAARRANRRWRHSTHLIRCTQHDRIIKANKQTNTQTNALSRQEEESHALT